LPISHGDKRSHIVSFSGIDGSGKSTQIEALCACLRAEGLSVAHVRFWDDVARLTSMREGVGHRVFRGDKGVGSPGAPIVRRDKNVQNSGMTYIRLFLYTLDAIALRRAVRSARKAEQDVTIFDRYCYDEFANLKLSNRMLRWYIQAMMKLIPKPDISYLLDVEPAKAFARKPEYPLEFLHANREAYLELTTLIGGFTVIPAMTVQGVAQAISLHAQEVLSLRGAGMQ